MISQRSSIFPTLTRNSLGEVSNHGTPSSGVLAHGQPAPESIPRSYKGFVAGVFSGIAKLGIGHPFDTIKVRLQTSSQFAGPLDCVTSTLQNEGLRGFYKGATPPLVGWMVIDGMMLGSMTLYRRLLKENVFCNPALRPRTPAAQLQRERLPSFGHGIAGTLAGITVSFISAPVEHVKARLQVQYAADKSGRMYKGPVDCATKILKFHGFHGLYHGFLATLIFRSFFFFWWGSYDVMTRCFHKNTSLSTPSIVFLSGGLSSQVFWLTSFPFDVVKQRIMTDPLGGKLGDGQPRFTRWKDAAITVGKEGGWRGYWRGFLPCFLRAFPANGMALLAFEGAMAALPD